MPLDYKILDHPSDLGIEAHGESIEELFRNSALGLMSVITERSEINMRDERNVYISALDRENLLVRWLTEILYLFDAEKFLTGDMNFELFNDISLKAKVFGEPYTPGKHELKIDVKAITYHQLKIEEHEGLWTARVFVDI